MLDAIAYKNPCLIRVPSVAKVFPGLDETPNS